MATNRDDRPPPGGDELRRSPRGAAVDESSSRSWSRSRSRSLLFLFADSIRDLLTVPAAAGDVRQRTPARLQALGPAEVLTTNIKLSLIGAIVLSAPWILWQAWKFIEPGLYREEKRFVHVLLPGSALLTLAGLAFLYWVMLPLMLQVLISFGVPGPADAFGIPEARSGIGRHRDEGMARCSRSWTEPPERPAPGRGLDRRRDPRLMMVVPVPCGQRPDSRS